MTAPPDVSVESQRLAGASPAAWLRLLLPAVTGVVLDLLSKVYSFPDGVDPNSDLNGLHPQLPAQPLIPHILGFRTTVNHGAVFGVGQGHGSLFVLFSFVALGVIVWVFAHSRRSQWVLHIALGLIIAGAIGNLYDRLTFGVVRDFLVFETAWFPYIFNVADSLLCVGVPLLMICWVAGNPEASATSPWAAPRGDGE